MVDSLVKHLCFERILPLLPVESTLRDYSDVEADEMFLMCRSVLMDAAVAQDINPIVDQMASLMELILRDGTIIAAEVTEEAVQSILVLARLLSDVLEYYWDHNEMARTASRRQGAGEDGAYERQKRLFTGSMVGYSTHRPCFHTTSPPPLHLEGAKRALDICSRIKFNTKSIRILRDMSNSLYGSSSAVAGNILPAYQQYLKQRNYPMYATKVDLTVDYILRFLAASNPTEFTRYIRALVLKPLLESHTIIELNVVQHLDLIGCVFLNRMNLAMYLEMIKNLSNTIKKTIYHCMLLYYASKTLMFWIMARPGEYLEIYRSLKDAQSSGSSPASEKSLSIHPSEENLDDDEQTKSISQLVSSLFDDVYSTFNVSTMLTAIPSYNSSSTPQSASSYTPVPPPYHTPPSASAHFPSSGPLSPPLYASVPQSSTPPSLPTLTASESFPKQSLSESSPTSYTQDTLTHSASLDDSTLMSKKNPDAREGKSSDVPHLRNILDLYTTSEDSESLSHSCVLRFLATLIVLDPDVFPELNATSFRNIADARKSGAYDVEEKEKSQSSIRHLTHGLKRLTTLPIAKKKGVKLMTMLVRNLNGSLLVTDVAYLDTMRALLTFFTISSSIALLDDEIPLVVFTKRLFSTLAVNLDIGTNWEQEAKLNPFLQKALSRHQRFQARCRIEFFAAAIQFDQEEFLNHLHLEDLARELQLKRLGLYTEGFRNFFHLPSTRALRKDTASKTSVFFTTLFSIIPDILLKAFPYFDDKVSDIVSAILDGSILQELDESNLFRSSSQSSTSSMLSTSPCQSIRASPANPSNIDTNRIEHSLDAIQSNSASSSETSSINTSTNQPDPQLGQLAAPRAHRISGSIKKNLLMASPGASEVEATQQVTRAQTDSSYSSSPNTPKTVQSSLSQARSRRASDESFPKPSKLSNPLFVNETSMGTSLEEYDDARKIMVNIFSIFKRLTNYFILPQSEKVDEKWASTGFKTIIKPIFVAIIDSDIHLQQTAQSFMDVLINYIPGFSEGSDSAAVRGCYLLCSYTVTLFSTALFDLKLTNMKREVVIDIIVKFLKLRTQLAKGAENSKSLNDLMDVETETFPLIAGTIGRALLVSLYSNKSSVQKLLKTAYGEFYQVIKFHEKTIGFIPSPWSDNLGFVEAMSQDNYVASGSVAFQRRLRLNILKYIKRPDATLLDSMDVIYKKWLAFSRSKSLSQEELADFRSFAGILASICGVLLAVGDEKSPHLKDLKVQVTNKMDYFIKKQCMWLNNPDLLTRENSRDILSTELHPLAFKLLFSNLRSKIADLSSIDLSESSHDLSFVLLEQIIIILRTILRRDDDDKILLLFSLDVIGFIDQLVEIVDKIRHQSVRFFKAIIQMSKMFRALENAEVCLGVVGHFHLKNRWLRLVTNWFNLTIVKDYDLINLCKPHREMDLKRRDFDYLYIDTLIESSRALAYLTHDVPLEVPPSVSEEELRRSNSVVFGNYFSIFLKGLEKSTDLGKFPASLKHKISTLNENVIIALTNLSNANVDAGFEYSLPMGCSPNRNIRLAFLKVFINIFSNYSTNRSPMGKAKTEAVNEILLHLIKHPNVAIKAAAVCPASDIEACGAGLITAFDSRNASYVIVTELIAEEIRNAPRHMDILRRNSCATRALSLFSRLKGNDYLVHTLNPVLSELLEKGEFFEIEKPQTDTEEQVRLFVKYMRKLIDAITNSVEIFPPELFIVCQTIYTSVKRKFPDYAYVAAGSFMFLRFFCPALVSPESESIVAISQPHQKRPFITLAKVIQNIANGTDNLAKWPSLESQTEFLRECSNRIFDFLKEICRTDRDIAIPINLNPKPVAFESSFLHRYLYTNELEIRKVLVDDLQSMADFELLKNTILMMDRNMAVLGQPKVEFRNEIPAFIKDHMEEYPQLYEFMSRHAFRNVDLLHTTASFAHESMSSDGVPILTLTFGKFSSNGVDIDTVVYRTFQIYARIWSAKHYLVLDCTEFDDREIDVRKLTSLFSGLLPPLALSNCRGYFYFNVGEVFISKWGALFSQINPFISHKVPHHFLNSYTDPDFAKSLGLSGRSLEVLQDVRVSLHDISLFDAKLHRFNPVSLKIGNKYFQVLNEIPKQYKFTGWDKIVSLKLNDVYEISEITSVELTSTTGVSTEFTVNMNNSRSLILCSSKYLEIVKMFYYALDRIEEEFGVETSSLAMKHDVDETELKERYDIISHLMLVNWVGFLSDDEVIRAVTYNLLVVAQETFHLDCGVNLSRASDIYVSNDCCTFVWVVAESLAKTAPELTCGIWKYFLNALEDKVIPREVVPQTLSCLSYWTPNLYKYVYRMDEEEGPEIVSNIVRTLIRLTVSEASFSMIYVQQIWLLLAMDGRLTPVIFEEVMNHALDRDSEGREWSRVLCVISALPTIEVASQIIDRLMRVIKSFLPSLKVEASTQSWSELSILVQMALPLFFENPLMTQMFLPETLFIISLLIDVGPTEIRSSLHALLLNVGHSIAINEAFPEDKRKKVDEVCAVLSRQRAKFMFGFSVDKGRLLQNFSASSFVSKFAALEHFTGNLMQLIECSSSSEAPQWKTRYKKYLMDAVFNSDSFLSARAMMILGIIGKTSTSESLCRHLLEETMKVIAQPRVTDELIFLQIAHIFTYSKIVEGLDPSIGLVDQLFWLSAALIESPHPVMFEGSLIFMTKCLMCLYEHHFSSGTDDCTLTSALMKSRLFAKTLLIELEKLGGAKWDERNFTHNILALISRGLSIPLAKSGVLESLNSLFRYSCRERRLCQGSTHYLCYMFLLYLFQSPEQFTETLRENDFDEEIIELNDNIKMPRRLAHWLSSDECCPNITLYQGAVLFNSSISDEPFKLRFALAMRYLLNVTPTAIFKVYTVVEKELRRIAALDSTSECVCVTFDIVKTLVNYPEFNRIEDYNQKILRVIEQRGLQSITKVEIYDQDLNTIFARLEANSELIYNRKRLITMILSRMTCYV